MTRWRYIAAAGAEGALQTGEMAAESAADVRARLRGVGLLVIELRPVRRPLAMEHVLRRIGGASMLRALRHQRSAMRGDLLDSLATLIEAGMPLADALEAASGSARTHSTPLCHMLSDLHIAVRDGVAINEAMRSHPGWFDDVEIAVIGAAVHSGRLPEALRELADRREEADQVARKLTAALTYPAVVALIGLVVCAFLSIRTLPELMVLLERSGLESPWLTRAVASVGGHLPVLVPVIVIGAGLFWMIGTVAVARLTSRSPNGSAGTVMFLRRLLTGPGIRRRLTLARVVRQLAQLCRAGVPLPQAISIVSHVAAQPDLQSVLGRGADRIAEGESPRSAFEDPLWFDDEFRSLIELACAGGELEAALDRIGARYVRQSARLVDRLAALLEPAVIVLLAVFVGLVALATVLPLVRLKDMV